MLQLQLCAQWWPGDFAAWAVAEYGRLLPSGSTLALSLAVPGGGSDAGALSAAIGSTAGTVHVHTEDEVARWVAAAGLELTPEGSRTCAAGNWAGPLPSSAGSGRSPG